MSVCTISLHSVQEMDFRSIFFCSRRPLLDGEVAFFFASVTHAKLDRGPSMNVKCEITAGLDGSMAQLSAFALLSFCRQADVRKKAKKNPNLKTIKGGSISTLLAHTPANRICKTRNAQLCPNSLWNEDGCACAQGVFALSNSH